MTVSLITIILFLVLALTPKTKTRQRSWLEEVEVRAVNNLGSEILNQIEESVYEASKQTLINTTMFIYNKKVGLVPGAFMNVFKTCVGDNWYEWIMSNGSVITTNWTNITGVCPYKKPFTALSMDKALNITSKHLKADIYYKITNVNISQEYTWRLTISADINVVIKTKTILWNRTKHIKRFMSIEGLPDPLLASPTIGVLRFIKKHPTSIDFNNISSITIQDFFEFYNNSYYRSYYGIKYLDRFSNPPVNMNSSNGIETFLKPGEGNVRVRNDTSYLDRLYISNHTYNCITELWHPIYPGFHESFFLDDTTINRYIDLAVNGQYFERCEPETGGGGGSGEEIHRIILQFP